MPACWKSSPTSRPRAALFSNGSRARRCRASRPWNRAEDGGELTAERVTVLIHHRQEAEAAIALAAEAGLEVDLLVPVGLVGPAFAEALEELLQRSLLAYCDDRPGLALESLRVGLRRLVIEASTAAETTAVERLADIARQQGATLVTALPAPLYRVADDGRRLLPATLGATGGLVP